MTSTSRFIITCVFLCFSQISCALEPGDTAPHFELATLSASKLSLRDLRGHYVYLDFWASWCGPCRQSFPWMNSLQNKYQARGLKVVAINLDANRADADKFLKELPPAFQVAFDEKGTIPRFYGVKGMPTSFLISPEGKIVFQHSGFQPSKAAEIEAIIQQSLGQ